MICNFQSSNFRGFCGSSQVLISTKNEVSLIQPDNQLSDYLLIHEIFLLCRLYIAIDSIFFGKYTIYAVACKPRNFKPPKITNGTVYISIVVQPYTQQHHLLARTQDQPTRVHTQEMRIIIRYNHIIYETYLEGVAKSSLSIQRKFMLRSYIGNAPELRI